MYLLSTDELCIICLHCWLYKFMYASLGGVKIILFVLLCVSLIFLSLNKPNFFS